MIELAALTSPRSPARPPAKQIAAVVVAFGPDVLKINRLVDVLARECQAVYVMDNGGGRDAIAVKPETAATMYVIDMGGNRGIGEALNRAFRLAATAGFDYVATFDQDSGPALGQINALVSAIESVDCVILNDAELRQLTGKPNLFSAAHEIMNWGPPAPSMIVAKQGEYGSALITADDFFALPAYPLEQVVDPTGAGDTFAGGFVGLIANWIHGGAGIDSGLLRNAMAYGTALASFNVERFGTEALEAADPQAVLGRVADLWRFGRFDRLDVELR